MAEISGINTILNDYKDHLRFVPTGTNKRRIMLEILTLLEGTLDAVVDDGSLIEEASPIINKCLSLMGNYFKLISEYKQFDDAEMNGGFFKGWVSPDGNYINGAENYIVLAYKILTGENVSLGKYTNLIRNLKSIKYLNLFLKVFSRIEYGSL